MSPKADNCCEQEQQQRKRTLDQLAKQAEGQRQSIARLERDDARLSTLIDRITALLAEQRRKEESGPTARRARVRPARARPDEDAEDLVRAPPPSVAVNWHGLCAAAG